MAFSPSNETRPRYGQIYQTTGSTTKPAWRGVVWYDEGGVYRPLPSCDLVAEDSPVTAYEKMCEAAKEYGVTDLRRWSGEWPPQRSEP